MGALTGDAAVEAGGFRKDDLDGGVEPVLLEHEGAVGIGPRMHGLFGHRRGGHIDDLGAHGRQPGHALPADPFDVGVDVLPEILVEQADTDALEISRRPARIDGDRCLQG